MRWLHQVRSAIGVVALVPAIAAAQLPGRPASPALPVAIGRSVIALDGPWKFRLGDDPRWADPAFDDSGWESVDLTPPTPTAHDADVGLTGYVPGWTARGHARRSGFGWYRLRLTVAAAADAPLAIAGPPAVDDAYQLFVDGRLVGAAGDFSHATPVVYSIQPRIYPLPTAPSSGISAPGERIVTIAVRTWMRAGTLGEGPDVGGIHIAPAIGEAGAIRSLYQLEWLQTVKGYIVEVVEAAALGALALIIVGLVVSHRMDSSRLWLAFALVLLGLRRAEQAAYFWGQWESLQAFDLAVGVLLIPIGLAAWTIAWYRWLRLSAPWRTIGIATLAYLVAELCVRSWFPVAMPAPLITVFHDLSSVARLVFAALVVHAAYLGIHLDRPARWLAFLAIVLVSIGLFAQEVSALGVPGIWFPFGTGVSRTQYAYAAFVVVALVLLLHESTVRRDARDPLGAG